MLLFFFSSQFLWFSDSNMPSFNICHGRTPFCLSITEVSRALLAR
jgi:hypothetical protein